VQFLLSHGSWKLFIINQNKYSLLFFIHDMRMFMKGAKEEKPKKKKEKKIKEET
jgi:hypothetical protein